MKKITISLAAAAMAAAMLVSPVLAEEGVYTAGTNMDDACEIPTDEKIYGTTSNGYTFWYVFTAETGGIYTISAVNKTARGESAEFVLYDEDGAELTNLERGNNGTIGYAEAELQEGQTYYIAAFTRNHWDNVVDYVFVVENEESDTSNTLQADLSEGGTEEMTPGLNMDDALAIPFNEKVSGMTAQGNLNWYIFETGSGEEAEYKISTTNKTQGGERITIALVDEAGNQVASTEASSNGMTQTITQNLAPDSLYYVAVYTRNRWDNEIEYSLTVKDGNGDSAGSGSKPAQNAPAETSSGEDTEEDMLFD